MKQKKKSDDLETIVIKNRNLILDGILGTHTELQVEAAVSFARYMSAVSVTNSNFPLFLKILETNNRWIVDALINGYEARLLFSSIIPNSYLIERAFKLLANWHPGEIYKKVLLAVLGIIECAYYKSDDGYEIVKLEINHLNSVGKFINQAKDQDYEINRLILHILDKISQLGEYRRSLDKNIIAKHAFNIRIAYFDNTKRLLEVIPEVLLVKTNRKEEDVRPSKEFRHYLQKTENID